MNIIPLQPVAAQTFSVLLNGQNCQIQLFQKGNAMFMTLQVNNVSLLDTVICRNLVEIVRYPYLGFIGNLVFIDTQGDTDPYYTGLGTRYKLVYVP
jgi:hypothetical protein